jgi:MFS family permease
VITTAACGAAVLLVHEEQGGHQRVFEGVGAYLRRGWCIVREEPDVRRFLIANAAWEGTFAAARTFVFLYITEGLNESKTVAWSVLGVVAGGYVVAALVAGPLGDRFGLARVIFSASFLYGGGLLVAGAARQWHDWYYGAIFPVVVAGGIVMTLAWGLLFKLMPREHRGAISGLATTTKGLGLLLGAPLAGAAIDLARPFLSSTEGYAVLWPICGIPILAVIPLVARLSRAEPEGRAPADVAEVLP